MHLYETAVYIQDMAINRLYYLCRVLICLLEIGQMRSLLFHKNNEADP